MEGLKHGPKEKNREVRGTFSAVLLSLLIHAGLFLLATSLVVFTVILKKEQRFDPPIETRRPQMELKKPQVRVAKSARPKAAPRMVSMVNPEAMPSMDLPGPGGFGDGLGSDGLGEGFGMMPELIDISIFGEEHSIGSDLEGTFYHLIRGRDGGGITYSKQGFFAAINEFLMRGWDTRLLAGYYTSPRKIYSSIFVIPEVPSGVAPQAFGEEHAEGQKWLIHYKGQIVYPRDITFRFVGQGDAVMAVRFQEKVVFASAWYSNWDYMLGGVWTPNAADDRKWWMGNWMANVGDWITMKADEPYAIEILVGDNDGLACLMLAVQEKGVEYEIRPGGGPRLPAFKTAMPSHRMLDLIYRDMVPGEVCLTNGPIFNDYTPAESTLEEPVSAQVPAGDAPDAAGEDTLNDGVRSWETADGKVFEAEYVAFVGGKVILKSPQGRQTLLKQQLSEEDRKYIELLNPPQLDLSVTSTSSSVFDTLDGVKTEVMGHDYVYSGHIRQTGAGSYRHQLKAELFAIGVQRYAEKYILLDRVESAFYLTDDRDRSHSFSGRKVHLRKIDPRRWETADFTVRGEKDYGYLLVVTDERGAIIASKASARWLADVYEPLRNLPVGAYMDETGRRVFPEGPPRSRY